ncbi:carbohydrate ABC transporter permease [Microbacterium sulfonylureivorans]|uniref:carbohydrate ABC transporter permease n=1 Tax=Microbacterium sulfonylureivorans TaxID=2486854 RepID=UPI000FD6ED15|nr:sugar ABC transporter permease [Microbacterium sulfonylureivorans]
MRRESWAPYAFLAPFLLLFAAFTVVPSLATFWLAWWDWDPLGGQEWAGAANFVRMAADPRFWTATVNTLVIAAVATTAQVCIGLFLAHTVHRATTHASAALSVSLLVPYVTSGAAVAILVSQLVDKHYGLLTRALTALGWGEVDVLAQPAGAWTVVAGVVVWRWFGFTTLLMLATLASAPRDVFRAAELDGAGSWAQFRFLTLPLLGPVIAFSFITSVVGALQLFAEPLLTDPSGLTCGPTRQCQTLALLVYEIGFRDFQFGYAAAVSATVFVLAAGLVGASFAFFRRIGWTA